MKDKLKQILKEHFYDADYTDETTYDEAAEELDILICKVLERASQRALVKIEAKNLLEEDSYSVSGTYIDSNWVEVDKDSIINVDLNNL